MDVGGIEIKQASIEDAEIILQIQIQAYFSEAEIYNGILSHCGYFHAIVLGAFIGSL